MYEGPVQRLIDELGLLPGIGPKSAQRLAFHLLNENKETVERLAEAISDAAQTMRLCDRCFNVSEKEFCRICQDAKRDSKLLCVVAEPRDIQAIEKTREFSGRYHVLGGLLMPINGITADKLHIKPLLGRLNSEPISEVLLALNPTVDGETTANFLSSQISQTQQSVRVTKIASGLPAGGDLEYADQVTLGRAITGRTVL